MKIKNLNCKHQWRSKIKTSNVNEDRKSKCFSIFQLTFILGKFVTKFFKFTLVKRSSKIKFILFQTFITYEFSLVKVLFLTFVKFTLVKRSSFFFSSIIWKIKCILYRFKHFLSLLFLKWIVCSVYFSCSVSNIS